MVKKARTRLQLLDRRIHPTPSKLETLWAESFSGYNGRAGGELEEDLKSEIGIHYPFLTDAQWNDIAKIGGFRAGVRFELNIELQAYWKNRLEEKQIPDSVEEIQHAAEALKNACVFVEVLLENDLVFKGEIVEPQEKSLSEQKLDLQITLELMARSRRLLDKTATRLKKGPGRQPIYGDLQRLVEKLEYILMTEHSRPISRAHARLPGGTGTALDFVWAVMQVADPHVSKSHIENIVENHIADRRRFLKKYADYHVRNL